LEERESRSGKIVSRGEKEGSKANDESDLVNARMIVIREEWEEVHAPLRASQIPELYEKVTIFSNSPSSLLWLKRRLRTTFRKIPATSRRMETPKNA
jgi:hypothetical protein